MRIFVKNELKPLIQKSLLGFAAGVMVAASVWSLLIPAMEMSGAMGRLAFLPAAVGFIIGILFLLILDRAIPHLHIGCEEAEARHAVWKKSTMLILAVTIHNIPEGISSGAIFAGIVSGNTNITLAGAFALSIGIAIQNLPEGFIVSLPIRSENGRGKALFSMVCFLESLNRSRVGLLYYLLLLLHRDCRICLHLRQGR